MIFNHAHHRTLSPTSDDARSFNKFVVVLRDLRELRELRDAVVVLRELRDLRDAVCVFN